MRQACRWLTSTPLFPQLGREAWKLEKQNAARIEVLFHIYLIILITKFPFSILTGIIIQQGYSAFTCPITASLLAETHISPRPALCMHSSVLLVFLHAGIGPRRRHLLLSYNSFSPKDLVDNLISEVRSWGLLSPSTRQPFIPRSLRRPHHTLRVRPHTQSVIGSASRNVSSHQ